MAIAENLANLRFGLQAAKGTPLAASQFGLYLAGGTTVGGVRTQAPFEETTGARMRSDHYVSEVHVEGSPEFYVMPNSMGALLYATLGAKAVSGGGDPYQHSFTPATSRPWMTWWRNIGDLLFEESSDCKINTLTISGESGAPLRVTAEVLGLRPRHQTAAEATVTVETTNRFLHYDGSGALSIEGVATADIRAFTITISNNGEVIPGDSLRGYDISEGELTVQVQITKLFLATSLHNRLMYGASSPANDLDAVATLLELGGSPSLGFVFTRGGASPERLLSFSMPRLVLAPYDIQPGTGNAPLTESITLDALGPAASALTVVVRNGLAAYTAA